MREENAMMSARWKCSLMVVLVASFLTAGSAVAGVYWEAETVTRGMPGQADGVRMQKMYYTMNASRVEAEDGSVMIMDFDTMTMYRLDTRKRTYTQTDMKNMGMPQGMSGRDRERMEKMMEGMVQSMQVTPTDETKTIAGYLCRKYNVVFMMTESEYWVSRDVKGYDELKEIGRKMAARFDRSPMLKQMNIAAMMDQVDGFPVQTVVHVMGGTATTTLKKIEKRSFSPDLFQVPKGYTQESPRSPAPSGRQGP